MKILFGALPSVSVDPLFNYLRQRQAQYRPDWQAFSVTLPDDGLGGDNLLETVGTVHGRAAAVQGMQMVSDQPNLDEVDHFQVKVVGLEPTPSGDLLSHSQGIRYDGRPYRMLTMGVAQYHKPTVEPLSVFQSYRLQHGRWNRWDYLRFLRDALFTKRVRNIKANRGEDERKDGKWYLDQAIFTPEDPLSETNPQISIADNRLEQIQQQFLRPVLETFQQMFVGQSS